VLFGSDLVSKKTTEYEKFLVMLRISDEIKNSIRIIEEEKEKIIKKMI
jgi:hypothetical protein